MMIHPTAIVHPDTDIDPAVTIGPYAVVGPFVSIAEGSSIGAHTTVASYTRIGRGNRIYSYASLGEAPQDKKYQGEETWLEIGDHNVIREFVTLNRGTQAGGGVTRIGHDNWIMAYVHVAHDCLLGNHIVLANNASLAGHVTVEDYAVFGGFAVVHQYCRIGAYAMLAANARVSKDVLPYLMCGPDGRPHGLNVVGLSRNGFDDETIAALKRSYRVIYRDHLPLHEAIKKLEEEAKTVPSVRRLLEFIPKSTRGIIR
jgi:UDP-N-acetylglucosamine acyltransferase